MILNSFTLSIGLQQLAELAAVLYPACKRHALNTNFSTTLETRPRTLDRLLLLLENRFPQLTKREREVCALTIVGNMTQKISEVLDLSLNTVVTYRRRAYDKLGVSYAYALVREMICEGSQEEARVVDFIVA